MDGEPSERQGAGASLSRGSRRSPCPSPTPCPSVAPRLPSSPSAGAVAGERPGLRPPKRRPLGEPAGAPRAPGARPRGRSSCPPPHAVVVPERAAGLRWVGGAAAALPAGPPCAAVCGWGYRVRCPCRRAAARAVCRALWGSPPAPSALRLSAPPPRRRGRGGGARGGGGGGARRGGVARLPRRVPRVVRAARGEEEPGSELVAAVRGVARSAPARAAGRAAASPPPLLRSRPQVRRGDPLNLSILVSGGKETNEDSLSNGE